ncbi:hypothetical protein POM88_027292 [Heracleum sosnowskyi]|uniref:Uncharacterized protein n=1 Tax=Heracleum sosnowskyi TaxID=360622 RepID=A0AAD8I9T5_9APIA|nr:hypothetical protein POM88_027292 [Heracleum sosnowskyi]
MVCITLICISFIFKSFTDLVLYNEPRLNDEKQRTGHIFFYLADEGNNALSLGRGVADVHESSILASGSREDVGNWQLHLKSVVPYKAQYQYHYFPEPSNRTPHLTLYELLLTGLWVYQKFRCNATIIDILLRGSPYDDTCLQCKDSVLNEHVYCCATCGRSFITPISSPSIVLLVGDHTGKAEFTLQLRELKQLTGYSRGEVLRNSKIVHGTSNFPRALRVIKGDLLRVLTEHNTSQPVVLYSNCQRGICQLSEDFKIRERITYCGQQFGCG